MCDVAVIESEMAINLFLETPQSLLKYESLNNIIFCTRECMLYITVWCFEHKSYYLPFNV